MKIDAFFPEGTLIIEADLPLKSFSNFLKQWFHTELDQADLFLLVDEQFRLKWQLLLTDIYQF